MWSKRRHRTLRFWEFPSGLTLRLRTSVGLPHEYVVLAEPAESLIVMDSGSSEVFWIDASDAKRLADPRLLRKPQVFQSYADFF
jgi:hypothetical protein